MKLLFATHNPGKLRELTALLGNRCEVVSPSQVGLSLEVEEDADTFEGNAQKKARAFMQASGLPSLADDSGLCVLALNGEPGVYSARYGHDDAHRVQKLLAAMEGVPAENRQAFFECVLCLAWPSGEEVLERGRCDGLIATAAQGQGGFGYDPIFYVPSLGKTLSEVTMEEKSQVSHRGRAFRKMAVHIEKWARE